MKKGAFTAQAKRAHATVAGFAARALRPGSRASALTRRRAQFARNMERAAANRRRH